ncbi:hypothetical protein UlMin_008941 [Ulmus minor]
MAAFEKDDLPMLSNNHSQFSDDGDDSQSRRSWTRSASLSIAINSMESQEREASLVGHTGPSYANRGPNNIFRPTQPVTAGKKEPEPKIERFPSVNGTNQNDWIDDNLANRNEHLLRSGQLGTCNDPNCTTCPTYCHLREASWKSSKSSALFDYHENKCIVLNWPMAKILVLFRSVSDFIYLMHLFLQFRLAYVAPESRVFGAGELVDHPKKIALNYLRGYFLIDFFIALPLPQIIILLILPNSLGSSGANYAKNLLRAAMLFQYIPRLCRFLLLLACQSPTGFIFESALGNVIIDLLAFVLSGHAVGSCWYLFGLQRVNQCLRYACHNSTLELCQFIDCGHGEVSDQGERKNWIVNENAMACLTEDGFRYGIYGKAVQLTTEDSVITRYIYSLFWGFQQITTMAGNLVPSYFVWEVLFAMIIIGFGLFHLARLIWNLQNYLQVLVKRKLEMSQRRFDVEQWMSLRRLPDDLRRRVRQAERYHWEATRGVNEEMHLENLPEDLQTDIRRHLFKFIKKVWIFAKMDDLIIDAICAKLRQKTYIRGSKVLDNGGIIEKMTFIVRGTMESIGENGISVPLCEGDVCGDELLICCVEHYSVNRDGRKIRKPTKRLISNRMVVCLTNIEAYSLRAADIEEVVSLYSRLLHNPQVQGAIRYESPYWRGLAATRIQVAWRYRKKRLSRADTAQSNQAPNH